MSIDINAASIISKDDWIEGMSYVLYDENGGVSSGDTDIKGRGNGSWTLFPKKSYSLKLTNKTTLLGMPEHKRWALLANYFDKTLLCNELAFKIGTIFDNLAWSSRSAQTVLYMKGAYQGVYQLTEAIKIDSNRVDLNEIKKNNPTGGYILEIDNVFMDELFHIDTTHGVYFSCSDPDEGLNTLIMGDTITLLEKIQNDVQTAEDAIYSVNFTDPDSGYRKYLDVGSFIDWWIVEEIVKNYEINNLNGQFMYFDDAQQKYCMGPLWDFDASFGGVTAFGADTVYGFIVKNFTGWWINKLFEDSYFVSLVKERWNERKPYLDTLTQFIDQRASYLNIVQAGNSLEWSLGVNYSAEIARLKTWLSGRISWMDTAINGL
jgi:hypothetical protein